MTREEFIEALTDKGYLYEIVGDKLVVTHVNYVVLDSLNSLPSGVEFNNRGGVNLRSLVTLPSGVKFNNGGHVSLDSLNSLPSGVEFNNGGSVFLDSLKTIPSGVEFKNRGSVELKSLIGGDGRFSEWKGNIRGIGNKTLLNMMIKRGVFL